MEAELLDAIYANPADDAPRLVYSDWLQERGDPRGELIALQCATERTPADEARIEELLLQHGDEWMGELAPAIRKQGMFSHGKPLFRRGFLARATVDDRNARLCASRAWATVEEIWFWERGLTDAMRHARALHHPAADELCAPGPPWSVQTLEIAVRNDADLGALVATDRLPELRRLHFEGPHDAIEHARFAGRLELLEVLLQNARFVSRAASSFPLLKRLRVHLRAIAEELTWVRYAVLSLARDARGEFTVGTLAEQGGDFGAPFEAELDRVLAHVPLSTLGVASRARLDPHVEQAVERVARSRGIASVGFFSRAS